MGHCIVVSKTRYLSGVQPRMERDVGKILTRRVRIHISETIRTHTCSWMQTQKFLVGTIDGVSTLTCTSINNVDSGFLKLDDGGWRYSKCHEGHEILCQVESKVVFGVEDL